MKTLSETLQWYQQTENRKWKRISQSIELFLLSLVTITVMGIILFYGNGTKFQTVFIGFSGILAVSTFALIPPVYKGSTFNRGHIFLITLGLGCGTAISALTALLMLELQLMV